MVLTEQKRKYMENFLMSMASFLPWLLTNVVL